VALYSPLKGREMPNHKYIRRVMGSNGKWQYYYGTISDSKNGAKSVSDIRRSSQTNSSIKRSGWAENYLANRNKKVSEFTPKSIENGKRKASSKVKTSGEQWDTSVTWAKIASDEPTKEEYKQKADELEKELNDKITSNEEYYNNLYNQEKESLRTKLTNNLKSKYPEGIPESELTKINDQVEKDTKTLWEEVYKPMVDKVNDVIKENRDAVLRILKKKYSQED